MTLLTTDEFRAFQATELDDASLQIFLDAAELAIEQRYGVTGSPVTETVDGGQTYIFLRRRASSITSVLETWGDTDTTLAADDYQLRGDGVSVKRLGTGTNAATWWGAPVAVTYAAADDEAERKRIQVALVKLDLNIAPGASSEQIGSWMEQHQESSVWNYATQREAILDSLYASPTAPGFA